MPGDGGELTAAVKRRARIYLLAALLLTTLLGVGLPRLAFQPGMPVPSLENGQVVLPPEEDAFQVGVSLNYFFIIFLLMLAAGLLIFLTIRLLRGVHWKKLLAEVSSYLLMCLIAGGVLSLIVVLLPKSEGSAYAVPLPAPLPEATAPLGPVPSVLVWGVGLFLVGAVLLLGGWMIFARRHPAGSWELEAKKAREALLAGQDLREVILRCYQRMGLALQEEQHIERKSFMTSGDFERLLAAQGVPHDPVRQLTRLFEAVRYGRWQPTSDDEQKALGALEAILEYSHRTREAN